MINKKISIVIPVFNSSSIIPELLERLNAVFLKLADYQFELIMVNDGSEDRSWDVMLDQKNKYSDFLKIINFTKNYGQHNAILCGFSFCSGDFVITMDDDLQHPPEEIIKLIDAQKIKDADIVYGVYKIKHHSLIRNLGGYVMRKTSDYRKQNERGSSFRMIKKKMVDTLVQKHSQHFLFLDAALNWYNTNIQVVEVNHESRKSGKTGYSLTRLVYIYLNILYHYSTKPLKIIIVVGLCSSLISFLLGIRFIYNKFVHDVPLGYTSIIVAIMFSTSLILFCIGIIGNYLYKLYQLQQNKPPYSIKNVL